MSSPKYAWQVYYQRTYDKRYASALQGSKQPGTKKYDLHMRNLAHLVAVRMCEHELEVTANRANNWAAVRCLKCRFHFFMTT